MNVDSDLKKFAFGLFICLLFDIANSMYAWNMDDDSLRVHTASSPRSTDLDGDGCTSGTCTREEHCSMLTSIHHRPTGSCATRASGRWVCCQLRNNRETTTRLSSLDTNGSPTESLPYSMDDFSEWMEVSTPTTESRRIPLASYSGGCSIGKCVRIEECSSSGHSRFPPSPEDDCGHKWSPDTWVCCVSSLDARGRTSHESSVPSPTSMDPFNLRRPGKEGDTVTLPSLDENINDVIDPESTSRMGAYRNMGSPYARHDHDDWKEPEEYHHNCDHHDHHDYDDYHDSRLPVSTGHHTIYSGHSSEKFTPRSESWNNHNNNNNANKPTGLALFPYSTGRGSTSPESPDRFGTYAHKPERHWESDSYDDCYPGKCVRYRDCSSWDHVITEPVGSCRREKDWVCCRNVYEDGHHASNERHTTKPYVTRATASAIPARFTVATLSARATARPSTTTKKYRGTFTTVSTTSRSGVNLGGFRFTTAAPPMRSTKKPNFDKWQAGLTQELPTPKPGIGKVDGCIAGDCTRREDCTGHDVVSLNPTGMCNKRPGRWVCCFREPTTPSNRRTVAIPKPVTERYYPTSGSRNSYTNPKPIRETVTTERSRTSVVSSQESRECGVRRSSGSRSRRNFDSGEEDFRSGRSSGGIISRIVGGKEAEPYSWPWMAALYKHNSHGIKRFLCSGSLINDRYILTSAHVFTGSDVRNASSFLVNLGTHTGTEKVAELRIRSIKQHPEYRNRYHYNDIALLELEEPVRYNDFVSPICLPPSDKYSEDSELIGKNVTVTGWGDESFGGKGSEFLKEVTFPIVSRKNCNHSYVQVAANKFPRGITKDMLCAGSPKGGKDACQGDSGGPLTIQEGRRWVQVGIVSFGYQCGDPRYPGVYTKVSHYSNWIHQNIRRHG